MKKLKYILFLVIIAISSLTFLPSKPKQVKIENNEQEFKPVDLKMDLKTSKAYANEWYNVFGGPLDDTLKDACCDDQGNVYAIGSNGSASMIVIFNTTGNLLWNMTWGTTRGICLTIDPDENIYCVTKNSSGGFNIHKFNTSRELEWTRSWGTYSYDDAYDIALDSLGYVYVVGQANSGSGTDLLLLKYDKDGAMEWERIWSPSEVYTMGYGIHINEINEIHVVGRSYGQACIAKYSVDGNRIDEKVFSLFGLFGKFFSVVANKSGEIFVLGHDDNYSIPFMMKLNSLFDIEWRLNLTSLASPYAGNYELVKHSGVLYACTSAGGAFTLYQVSQAGTIIAEHGWEAPFCNYGTEGLGLCLDKHDNIYIPGSVDYCGTNPEDDAVLLKFGNDTDNDGLTNYQELNSYFTDPNNIDTDSDHWTDGEEVLTHSSAPLTPNIPSIAIYSPLTTFNDSQPPLYDIHIDAISYHISWYSLDNDTTRTFFTYNKNAYNVISNVEWNKQKDGAVKIEFFANDTRGNLGCSEVIVQKYGDAKDEGNSDDDGERSTEPAGTIPSYPFDLLFLVSVTFYTFILRKYLKKIKNQGYPVI